MSKEATEYKLKGNEHFGKGEYQQALTEYENALLASPQSLYKERAIYFANIAACHLKQVSYFIIFMWLLLVNKEFLVESI